MSKEWQGFVVFHKNIVDRHYELDSTFDLSKFTFLKTNESFPSVFTKEKRYRVIEEWKLGSFYDGTLQKKTYMAPSALYHLFKNDYHLRYKALGILEYDLCFAENTTKSIDQVVSGNPNFIIPLSYRHTVKKLYEQKNILIEGQNAIERIFADYNTYFNTKHRLKDFLAHTITSQQSFIADSTTFERIMKFITTVIEQKYCEKPNSWTRPSTLMDRYIGVAILLDSVTKFPIPLEHTNMHQWGK